MRYSLIFCIFLSTCRQQASINYCKDDFSTSFTKAGEGNIDTLIKYSAFFNALPSKITRHGDTILINTLIGTDNEESKVFIIDSINCKSTPPNLKRLIYYGNLLFPVHEVDTVLTPNSYQKEVSEIIFEPKLQKLLIISNNDRKGLWLYND